MLISIPIFKLFSPTINGSIFKYSLLKLSNEKSASGTTEAIIQSEIDNKFIFSISRSLINQT